MIPVNEPLLDGNEKKYLGQCVDSGWISSDGPFVKKFESAFANFLGVEHGVSVCNGTAALETALYAAGVGEGDEVIMPSFTIISCALACLRLGAKPVLTDIEPETWCMDSRMLKSKITAKTKAIMPVHIYGHPVDMDPVFDLAEKHGLKIVEDAAEAHGAEYFSKKKNKWLKCGAMGDVSAFSFYANKIISTGEGGMVMTSDAEMNERARSYRNLCFRSERRFFHTELGYNFRMTNLQAAVGLAQLEQIERFIEIKRKWAKVYEKAFEGVEGLRFAGVKNYARSVYWMYALELEPKNGLAAKAMMEHLRAEEIDSRPFFLGLHEQPVLRKYVGKGRFKHTEKASEYGFYVPSGLALTQKQVDKVCQAVRRIAGRAAKK